MILTTKYNIGQGVWTLRDTQIIADVIKSVTVYYAPSESEKVRILYSTENCLFLLLNEAEEGIKWWTSYEALCQKIAHCHP